MTLFFVEHSWERGVWEFDLGASLNLARWGLGFTADYLGRHAPNGVQVHLGPLALWVTVWNWKGLTR